MSALKERTGQLLLDLALPRREAMGRADFVVTGASEAAARFIDRWRDWPNRRLALTGPARSGKTHLAHVWMRDSGARRVKGADLTTTSAPEIAAAGRVAVEDFDRAAPRDEDALFHLHNMLGETGGWLLVTGRAAPAQWHIDLPDLRSRLGAIPVAELGAPDDALLSALLFKLFEDRGMRVDERLVTYLTRRMERSFLAAERVVETLDAAGLRAGRTLTPRFAGEALGWSGDGRP